MTAHKKSFGLIFLIISFAVVLVDQLTKYLVKQGTDLHLIENVFHITYLKNTGIAFGMLQNTNFLLIWLYIIALGIILLYYDTFKTNKLHTIFAALITGGIVGNFIDRIARGAVIDFINFIIWPVFNVADICLCIGIIGLIVYEIVRKK